MTMRCDARPWTLLIAAALLAALAGAAPPAATAADCLTPEGSPWEDGDNIYIKVKNSCSTPVGFSWEVGTYNYGVYGSPIGTPKTGSRAVKPGKTTTICAKKPAGRGRYCFRFKIKNKDQAKPNDEFKRWLNNIVVAMAGGGPASGTLEVGGSGLLANDVALAVAEVPPGWNLALSTHYVSTEEFPATVAWDIIPPRNLPVGQTAYLRIDAFDAVTGEHLGEAEFQAVVTDGAEPGDPDEVPFPLTLRNLTAGDTTNLPGEPGGPGGPNEPPPDEPLPPDEEPIPVDPPEPNFYTASEQNGGAVNEVEILVAWNEAGFLEEEAEVVFEYLGPEGWEQITGAGSPSTESPTGMAAVYWDTSELPAGDYPVRVIMTLPDGQVGTVQRVLRVTKSPVAVPAAAFSGLEVTFDGNASYDPDGAVLDYAWTFADGSVEHGSVVTHTFEEPGTHTVDLTVTDLEGNETTAYCLADTVDGAFDCEARTCGCESMDVKSTGDSSMNMHWMTAPDQKKLGDVSTIPNPLPAGGGPYRMVFNFEVVATLKPDSDPALCTSEQWVNRTSTRGGNTFDKKDGDGNEYPYGGDDYTHDNYTGNSGVQQSDATSIRWVDGPGTEGLTSAVIGHSGCSYKAQFFAMVTGPTGTCQCSWEVVMAFDKDGKATEGPELKNKVCS